MKDPDCTILLSSDNPIFQHLVCIENDLKPIKRKLFYVFGLTVSELDADDAKVVIVEIYLSIELSALMIITPTYTLL